MFILLLLINFVITLGICFLIITAFDKSISGIIKRIVPEEISTGWITYLKLTIYLVGISGGINIFKLESYLKNKSEYSSFESWVLEIYRTIMDTLGSIAWLLLVFFIIALIAYLVTRIFELKKQK